MSALPIHLIVDQICRAGLMVTLTTNGGLRVAPASCITPAIRDLIRTNKAALMDCLSRPTEAADKTPEIFAESVGYEGTGWLLAGADSLSPETLYKFRAASLELDLNQSANDLLLQGATT